VQVCRKIPKKIRAFRRAENSGSAEKNFFSMLAYADSDYIMFSDDDDVWLPDKIEKSMEMMHKAEQASSTDKPVLVHSDLMVVDENLNILSRSMFQRQNLDAKRCQLHNILVQNIVTGCTMTVKQASRSYR
jgi:GT2 family glycosyltransferase